MVYYAGDLRFYLSALEEERLKIYVFRRELPLCYEVVTQTIEAWKQKLKDRVTLPGQPIPEAFVPPRDDDDVVGEEDDDRDDEEGTRSGWLRSERPWNQIPDLNAQLDNGDEDCRAALPQKPPLSASQVKSTSSPERHHRRGRAERKASQKLPTSPVGSSPSGKAKGQGQEKHEEGSACRKKRRRWSPELHRQFLNALQELGGSHLATPRHIKERMKVDGLTNDEIKSHLQKYRLNKRNPSVQCDEGPPRRSPSASTTVHCTRHMDAAAGFSSRDQLHVIATNNQLTKSTPRHLIRPT